MSPDALKADAERLRAADMNALLAEPGRDAALQFTAAGLSLDLRRQRLDLKAWAALLELAESHHVIERLGALYAGDIANPTEGRAVLHPACRNPGLLADTALAERLRDARARTRAFSEILERDDFLDGHPVRRIVSIGIGGSDLGPRMVYDALKAFRRPGVEARFVSNLDPADLDDALEGADPQTTLILVVSKSFTTQETLMNARAARAWLAASLGEAGADARFAAATAAPDKAKQFGLDEARIFPFEDGVGGRYSLWSPAGLSLELAFGPDRFDQLLAGAKAMDDHAVTAAPEANMVLAKGLADVWNRVGAAWRPIRRGLSACRPISSSWRWNRLENRYAPTGPHSRTVTAARWSGAGAVRICSTRSFNGCTRARTSRRWISSPSPILSSPAMSAPARSTPISPPRARP